MRKILLSVAFVGATFVGANAQQQTVSFEASEGFTLGNINGQQGWTTSLLPGGGNVSDQVITNEMATEGSQSFKITYVSNVAGQANPNVGAFYELPTPFTNTDEYVVAFDINVSEQSDTSSDFVFAGYTTDAVSFYFRLRYTGTIFVADERLNDDDQPTLFVVNTEATWLPQTTYNVKVVISHSNENVEYYVNNDLIHTSTGLALAPSTEPVVEVEFVHDNWGGFAYLDHIFIGSEEQFLGVDENVLTSTSFSVYPNPATDVINISNSADLIENVSITDLNGRVVKQATLGVNQGQINISDLSQGVYILEATANGKTITEKLIKN